MMNTEQLTEYNREYQKRWRQERPEIFRAICRRSYLKHRDRILRDARKKRSEVKLAVLKHYGKEKATCVHCGFDDVKALSIDHIDGGGTQHAKILGVSGMGFYRWLQKHNYPSGYQTLCMNCQWIKKCDKKETRIGRMLI